MNTLALRNHTTVAVSLVVLFWAIAAAGVMSIESVPMKMAVILTASFAFMRFGAPEPTLEWALSAGVTWAALSVAAEIAAAVFMRHGWFALIGSPSSPAMRNLLLITWIAAPAVFARKRG